MTTIRALDRSDLASLQTVIDTTKLFPSEFLEGMLEEYVTNPSSHDVWLTGEVNQVPIAVAYYAPERLTEGTYNLYLIAVHKDFQDKGIGASIMRHVEQALCERGMRILLVETSGLPEFERTRAFYDKCNYTREAVIRDFYKEGEDKVIFWKRLTTTQ
jgi:ribosomal protein S18 acetylase RimI-like enzyme